MYELDKISCVNCIVVSAKISLYFASAFILELTSYFFINGYGLYFIQFFPLKRFNALIFLKQQRSVLE